MLSAGPRFPCRRNPGQRHQPPLELVQAVVGPVPLHMLCNSKSLERRGNDELVAAMRAALTAGDAATVGPGLTGNLAAETGHAEVAPPQGLGVSAQTMPRLPDGIADIRTRAFDDGSKFRRIEHVIVYRDLHAGARPPGKSSWPEAGRYEADRPDIGSGSQGILVPELRRQTTSGKTTLVSQDRVFEDRAVRTNSWPLAALCSRTCRPAAGRRPPSFLRLRSGPGTSQRAGSSW